jgi:arylsulfatase A-like enzyme
LRLVGVASLGVALFFACADSPNLLVRPQNVILIVVDTLRADRLSLYGNPRATSPNIEALAERALVFERAFSHAPWTPPSMASLFTSTRESVHQLSMSRGQQRKFSVLNAGFETLAEYLRRRGYRTVAVSSQPWISEATGFAQGFDDFFIVGSTSQKYETEKVAIQAVRQLRAHADERFFLYLHFMAPHTPYDPPSPFASMGWNRPPPAKLAPYAGKPNRDVWKFMAGDLAGDGPERATPEDVEYLVSVYDSEVLYVDWWIGVIRRELLRLELSEETLVVLVADHGESFFEHGRLLHGDHLYNEVLRVPLIFSHPALFEQGRRIDDLAGIVDVFPTIVDLLGGEPLEQFQGKSLVSANPRGWNYAERRTHGSGGEVTTIEKIQTPKWSLIWDQQSGSYELYALDDDPREQSNVIDAEPEAATKMIDLLMRARGDNYSHPDRVEAANTALDEQTVERLRSLGYLE